MKCSIAFFFLLFLLPVLITGSYRIVGGEFVENQPDAPFMVRIYGWGDYSLCGGLIISKRCVLTAAHCINVTVADQIGIKPGDPRLDVLIGVKDPFSVEKYWIHPGWNNDTLANDIALIKLDKELTYSENVQPVKLPKAGEEVPAGTVGKIYGWGKYNYTIQKVSYWLRVAEMTAMSESDCEAVSHYVGRGMPAGSAFCALDEDHRSTCKGDSGGPFMNGDTVVGLTSWGTDCGVSNHPTVFTKVSYYIDFIDKCFKDE